MLWKMANCSSFEEYNRLVEHVTYHRYILHVSRAAINYWINFYFIWKANNIEPATFTPTFFTLYTDSFKRFWGQTRIFPTKRAMPVINNEIVICAILYVSDLLWLLVFMVLQSRRVSHLTHPFYHQLLIIASHFPPLLGKSLFSHGRIFKNLYDLSCYFWRFFTL